MVVGYDSFRNKSIQTTDQKCDVSIIWLDPFCIAMPVQWTEPTAAGIRARGRPAAGGGHLRRARRALPRGIRRFPTRVPFAQAVFFGAVTL